MNFRLHEKVELLWNLLNCWNDFVAWEKGTKDQHEVVVEICSLSVLGAEVAADQ